MLEPVARERGCVESDELACEYALNENSGQRIDLDGRVLYLAQVGEKAGAGVTVRVSGRSGDSSVTSAAESPLTRLAASLARLTEHGFEVRLTAETGALLERLAPGARPEERLVRAWDLHPALARVLPPMCSTRAGPSPPAPRARATPFRTSLLRTCRARSCPAPHEVMSSASCARRSVTATTRSRSTSHRAEACPPRVALVGRARGPPPARSPAPSSVPVLGLGYTESDLCRELFGTVAYGFTMFRHTDPLAVVLGKHGPDEAVAARDAELQARLVQRVVAHVSVA